MPLTDTAIKALKPRAKRYSVTDEKGLVLEVFPTGGMLWHYRYRLNGKQERVTLGRYPDLSLKLARVLRGERATQVAFGKSPAKLKRQAKAADATTVADVGGRFFREIVAKDRKDPKIPRRYFDKQGNSSSHRHKGHVRRDHRRRAGDYLEEEGRRIRRCSG
jgi:hypothetical protein